MNDDRSQSLHTIRTVFAADYCCDPGDFERDGVTVVPAGMCPGRRPFPVPSKPLQIVTMGAGVVISCAPERVDWLRAAFADQPRDAIFDAPAVVRLAAFVDGDRQDLDGPSLRHACSRDRFRPVLVPADIEIAVVERDGMAELYLHPGFHHALSYQPDHPRPDEVAAVAYRGGRVIGVAAASSDSDELWQVGVDVVEDERRGGIGRAVVSRVTELVLARGKVPYYATAVSNIASRSVAIGLGYWPAWTEMFVRDRPAGDATE